jgi:pyruvate,water dikinase
MAPNYIRWFEEIGTGDVASVGGKNASLGEMVRKLGSRGIKVPTGFATTADAYWHFIKTNRLEPLIVSKFAEFKAAKATVTEIGSAIRSAILKGAWPEDMGRTIRQAYQDVGAPRHERADVAVRSSATAEDLPEASLPVSRKASLTWGRMPCLPPAAAASLPSSPTAPSSIARQWVDHLKVGFSVGVQQMVRSDLAGWA